MEQSCATATIAGCATMCPYDGTALVAMVVADLISNVEVRESNINTE